jgi:ArsR family transcriptional regulator
MPVAKLEVFDARSVELAVFARALGHPARIRILRHLAAAGGREVACMELVEALPLSQPACSRHIHELRRTGLLKSRAKGSHVFFRLDPSVLKRFCKAMDRALHPGG